MRFPFVRSYIALTLSAAVSGCAYFHPYIHENPPPLRATQTNETNDPLPEVTRALKTLDAWSQEAADKRDSTNVWHRSLDLLTFGLVLGAAIAPVYKASYDTITGLAIGAGTTYAGNTLFVPLDQVKLYNSAVGALGCVYDRGNALRAAIAGIEQLQAATEPYMACTEVEQAYLDLSIAKNRVVSADFSAGQMLTTAGRNIIVTLNQEIDRRAPSSEAIVAAAKSAASIAIAPRPTGKQGISVAGAQCPRDDASGIARAKASLVARSLALDSALDAVGALNTSCVLNFEAVPALTVSQDAVLLMPKVQVNIVVAGGRPPYQRVWETDPGGQITVDQPAPNIFSLKGNDAIVDGKSFNLIISDSSPSGRTKTIVVSTKK